METVTPIDADMRERVLDVRGQRCPMPLIKARQELPTLGDSEVLKVLATDRGSMLDFQALVRQSKGYVLLSQAEQKDEAGRDVFVHRIARAI